MRRQGYRNRWQSFLGNAAAITAFAPRDLFTAQHLSPRLGNKMIIVESENNRAHEAAAGHGRSPQGVPLIRPEGLMELPDRPMLCRVSPVQKAFITQEDVQRWIRKCAKGPMCGVTHFRESVRSIRLCRFMSDVGTGFR